MCLRKKNKKHFRSEVEIKLLILLFAVSFLLLLLCEHICYPGNVKYAGAKEEMDGRP